MSIPAETCATCLKPQHLCVCEAIDPVDNRIAVVILEHPQEKREVLGTAQITRLQLKNATVRVGLSWPGLKRILGHEVDYKRWGVLYLGAAKQAGEGPREEIAAVDRNGKALADSDAVLAGLDGIILLDGTWSQAKTLWWRNPWLLKCRRLVLNPRFRSLYGQTRREPRRDSVSTLEAAAFALSRLENDPTLFDRMLKPFALLLKKTRAPRPRPPVPSAAAPDAPPAPESAPAPAPAPDDSSP
ncbi:tRNA-uridine aminocarboxypropyltransferase [Azospirillum halopraeferens]|uniref:tRNA-uridine aminocarboxypropyltransferase n=1 Tax=Azospirillum halopraeferens TaxID=34010 RepID=UPI0003FEB17C|nr:tRNA-uridine aminocarboxypropyltransferase [Azospirillum halopraeferens]